MQEPNPLHHVHSYLHSGSKVQAQLEGGMEVPGVSGHDEEDDYLGVAGVVVVYECTHQVHHSVILGQCPRKQVEKWWHYNSES